MAEGNGKERADRSHRLRELFALGCELPFEEREAFCRRHCANERELYEELRELLDAVEDTLDSPLLQAPVLERSFAQRDPVALHLPAADGVDDPEAIGPYVILSRLGEGGMGVVYLADQTEPVRRRVALKVIKPGMDTRRVLVRFEAERQSLARMNHPGVAKILDGGATADGRPFFAMELVEGEQLQVFCREARLSIRERLELFCRICDAVQHAHDRGIVHRDLKPSNVLIEVVDGLPQPKIIDFGIARAMNPGTLGLTAQTIHGELLGTLEYMSPEQALGDTESIDEQSDVFSLGAVLYELLTGEPPIDRETLSSTPVTGRPRMFAEHQPVPPSVRVRRSTAREAIAASLNTQPRALSRALAGDLDWVVLKALERDRSRRYAGVRNLGTDIRRFLAHEPVLAAPPSKVHRARKFVRRHRVLVAATSSIVVALLAATAVSAGFALDAKAQARLATEEGIAAEASRIAARNALDQERRSLQELHDTLSTWSSSLTGNDFSSAPRMVELREEIIERDVPGFRAQWFDIEFAREATMSGQRGSSRARGELLIQSFDSMGAGAKSCAAQLLVDQGRRLLTAANVDGATRLLECAEAFLRETCSTDDPRLVLARVYLADALIAERSPEAGGARAAAWAAELIDLGHSHSSFQVALMRSREGAAAVEQEEFAEGKRILSEALHIIEASTSGSRIILDAKAALIRAYDQLGLDGAAHELRVDLDATLRRTPSYSPRHLQVLTDGVSQEFTASLLAIKNAAETLDADIDGALGSYLSARAAISLRDHEFALQQVETELGLAGNACGNLRGWDHPATIQLYEEALRVRDLKLDRPESDVSDWLWGAGYAFAYSGDLELADRLTLEAWQLHERAKRVVPASVRFARGVLLCRLGKYEEAHDLLLDAFTRFGGKKSIKKNSALATFYWINETHLAWGDDAAAQERRAELDRTLRGVALFWWHVSAGEIEAIQFKRSSVQQRFGRARADGNALGFSLMGMADGYSRLGNLKEAVECLERALEHIPQGQGNVPKLARAVVLSSLGEVLLRHGDPSGAVEAFEEANGLYEGLVAPYAGLSQAAHQRGDIEGALAWGADAIARGVMTGARAMGPALHAAGRSAEAIPHFERFARTRVRPDGGPFWRDYGAALVANDQSEKARATLQRLVETWPDDPYAWHAHSQLFASLAGTTPKSLGIALRSSQRAAELSRRQSACILLQLALLESRSGRRAEALKILKEIELVMRDRSAEWVTRDRIEACRERIQGV